ncbi:MAG: MaoC family dehydratase [Actinobacteria bacterium]|nr:MaoC family dehydratase [Actinomycetota bacterium]
MALPEPGAAFTRRRTFTQGDFDRFAGLSGDDNPIHVDAEYSAAAAFGRPVAHGMFLYSCLCGLLAEAFPGAVQRRQDLKFPAPTFTGEQMTLRAEVSSSSPGEVVVATEVTRADGTVTATGSAVLRVAS